jgi:NTP pyrophosphatase (non-canonical NTP hydrolase)
MSRIVHVLMIPSVACLDHQNTGGDHIMTLDEYAQWATTVPRPDHASRAEGLAYAALGLVGEVGEVADTLRRGVRDGSLNEDRLIHELGDLLFHWVSLCIELDQPPAAMVGRSRANIEERLAGRAVNAFVRPHPDKNLGS